MKNIMMEVEVMEDTDLNKGDVFVFIGESCRGGDPVGKQYMKVHAHPDLCAQTRRGYFLDLKTSNVYAFMFNGDTVKLVD